MAEYARQRPTRDDLVACAGRRVQPVLAPGLRVLFCGINPGLYTAWAGHHFAKPGNRFWPTLHRSGFTPRQFRPAEQAELLSLGLGLTNLVDRATAGAAELDARELRAGGRALEEVAIAHAPAYVAILGVTAYRSAFGEPKAELGPQPMLLGASRLWVLPNPSGLNAHYQPDALARLFAELRVAVTASEDDTPADSTLDVRAGGHAARSDGNTVQPAVHGEREATER